MKLELDLRLTIDLDHEDVDQNVIRGMSDFELMQSVLDDTRDCLAIDDDGVKLELMSWDKR